MSNPSATAGARASVLRSQKAWASVLAVLVLIGVSWTLTDVLAALAPGSTPQATSFTLNDIYTRLTTNAAAVAGGHSFLAPNGTPAQTQKTLTEIYNAVPTITPSVVMSGTTLMGVPGTLVPPAGTARAVDIFNGTTAHAGIRNWNLTTGTLKLACAIRDESFDGTRNLVDNAHDGGSGFGNNRWCMKASDSAFKAQASDIRWGKKAWIDGREVTGTIPTQTLFATSTAVNAGYYDATSLELVNPNLIADNIRNGVNIFGITGSSTDSYTYGIPKTGVTDCSDMGGNSISCAGTGQDGEYQKGVNPVGGTRWTTSGPLGTASDNSTGLMWTRCDNAATYSPTTGCATNYHYLQWQDAITYCEGLTLGGYTDWHLPNILELRTLVDVTRTTLPYINTTIFPGLPGSCGNNYHYHWSSTTRPDNSSYAYGMEFACSGGRSMDFAKGGGGIVYAFCVRNLP